MSSRFGRNQKRALGREIADLKARLLRESTAHAYIPFLRDKELAHLNVLDFSETENGGAGMRIERHLTLEIDHKSYKDVVRLANDCLPVQFRGRRYLPQSISMPNHHNTVTLGLVGIAGE